ncbi:MAG TPA: antibiotic biosynthesis monooxygenase [Nitrosopumilaceae archaeon]|nr:antibiotic biosynthesis monooxygenase [Nitrosopumilaceae archaeon]
METSVNKIVRYRVKKKKLRLVRQALLEFIDSVRENEPNTLVYEVFQEKDNPASFIHVMSFKDKNAEKTHTNSKYLKKWVDILYPNCKQEPEFTNLRSVKSNKITENNETKTVI